MEDIGLKTFKSSLWMILSKWIVRSFGVVSVIILARLLMPDDYGIAALAQVTFLFFQIIFSDGSGTYLIRKKNLDNDDLNTAWSIRLTILSSIAVLLFLYRYEIADFMDEPRLADVLIVSALSSLIMGFNNIGIFIFIRDLNYKPIFIIKFYQKLAGFIVTLIIAILYQNYWALIIGSLALVSMEAMLSYIVSDYRPHFTYVKFKQQWNFTKWLFFQNIASFIRNKTNDILIPKYLGSSTLGIYSMAYQMANMFYEQVISPALSPIYSSFSTIRDDNKALSLMFVKALGIISIIMIPAYSGLFLLSEPFIIILLGESWREVIEIFEILLGFVFIQAYIFLFTSVALALGRVKLFAFLNWGLALILLPVIYYSLTTYGLVAAVIYRTILAFIFLWVFVYYVNNMIKINWRHLITALFRPALSSLIMSIFILITKESLDGILSYQFLFIISIINGMIVYTIALLSIWIFMGKPQGGESFILDKAIYFTKKNTKLNQLLKKLAPA